MGFHFKIGAVTDVGKVRAINEDSFSAAQDLGLFTVADGLGGQNAGEVASKMAIEVVKGHLDTNKDRLVGEYKEEFSRDTNRMLSGDPSANAGVGTPRSAARDTSRPSEPVLKIMRRISP